MPFYINVSPLSQICPKQTNAVKVRQRLDLFQTGIRNTENSPRLPTNTENTQGKTAKKSSPKIKQVISFRIVYFFTFLFFNDRRPWKV